MSFDELFNWLKSNKLNPVKVNDHIITFSQICEVTFGSITEHKTPDSSEFMLQYRTKLSHLPLYFTENLSYDSLLVELDKFVNFPKKD